MFDKSNLVIGGLLMLVVGLFVASLGRQSPSQLATTYTSMLRVVKVAVKGPVVFGAVPNVAQTPSFDKTPSSENAERTMYDAAYGHGIDYQKTMPGRVALTSVLSLEIDPHQEGVAALPLELWTVQLPDYGQPVLVPRIETQHHRHPAILAYFSLKSPGHHYVVLAEPYRQALLAYFRGD